MYPTLDEVRKIAASGDYRRIPVSRELYADAFTPVEVLRTLRAASHHCYLLESAEENQKWGRYSFLGYSPAMELTCQNGVLKIRTGEEDELAAEETRAVSHPGETIREILAACKSPKLPDMPPFTGGLVGYFSYDYIHYAEPTLDFSKLKNDDFCDVDLMLFDRVIVFDHYRQKLILIAGASPETLTRLTDGTLYTFPLAGTRPRRNDKEEDEALERELLADEKELSEHNMLVDLGRNDLGRVSRLGSVQVETYASVVRFSHVMHIGSTVRGEIHPDHDAVDAIDSILPAGTLSGAPKVRACEIIAELEGRKRGIYGGAIGYLDFTGNMDTCIAIRLAYKKHGRICGQYGKDCAPAICSGICKVNERRHPGVSNDYLPINFVSKAVQKNVFS